MISNTNIAFLYGILVKIVDDIIDFHIFPQYSLFFQFILILLTIYVVFYNKILSPIASITFTIGGILAFFFIPHSVNSNIWKIIILLSIPNCLKNITDMSDIYNSLETKEIKNLFYFVFPLLFMATIFSIIEDILVPEEYSKTKIIDKTLQSIMMMIFIYILPFLAKKINLREDMREILQILAWGWMGYSITSVIILTQCV